jgi:hypothetical protein
MATKVVIISELQKDIAGRMMTDSVCMRAYFLLVFTGNWKLSTFSNSHPALWLAAM